MNIAFYSYKGGVGRTQLVANLAKYLFLYENKKVLLMDWDLEAPGLHFYFKKPNENKNFSNEDFKNKGLLDVLEEYIKVVRSKNPEEIQQEDLPIFREENIVKLAENVEKGAKIDLIPAGIYGDFAEYRRKVIGFNWQEFYETLDGIRYLEFVLKPQISKGLGYDFVLIDSRTGISDYQNISNVQMADANIIIIAPNMQNLEGCVAFGKSIIDSPYIAQGHRKPIVMPVLSRAETLADDFPKFKIAFEDKTNFLIQELAKHLPFHLNEKEYYKNTLLFYNKFIAIGEHSLFEEGKEINEFAQQIKNIANYLLFVFMVETKNIKALASFSDQKRSEKDFISAEKALSKAIEIEENNSAIIHKLVSLYRQRSQTEKALTWIEKGLTINPNDKMLNSEKERVLEGVKNPLLEQAINLINNLQIADYFSFMKNLVGENPTLTKLQNAFILGKTDVDFYEQLKSFAEISLRNYDSNNTRSTQKTSLKSLYDTLNQKFNDESLNLFCQLFFEEVYNNFSLGQSKTAKIFALLDYAKRKDLLGKLESDLADFLKD